jgi:hypothetical protein
MKTLASVLCATALAVTLMFAGCNGGGTMTPPDHPQPESGGMQSSGSEHAANPYGNVPPPPDRPGSSGGYKPAGKPASSGKSMKPAPAAMTDRLEEMAAKPGFEVKAVDGRLWVFKPGQKETEKHVTMIGAGPAGATLKAVDRQTALEYVAAKPGFNVKIADERLWVLKPGEEEKEKHITIIGAGPLGMTIKALNRETALEYIASKPGFEVHIEDGRLWILKPGREKKEKHITMIGAGPLGMTLKALDKETALEYVATKPGFSVEVVDGRLWVFRAGHGTERPEKHVTRIGAGPRGMTVKAPDRDTLDAYLGASG